MKNFDSLFKPTPGKYESVLHCTCIMFAYIIIIK